MSERHTIIKHRNPKTGELVDKVVFDLTGLTSEEAAERVWAVFQSLGWVE